MENPLGGSPCRVESRNTVAGPGMIGDVGQAVARVLAAYPDDCQPLELGTGRRAAARGLVALHNGTVPAGQAGIESLGAAGGFSGAQFWRIAARRGLLCLRQWPPEHPTRHRLEWTHAVLRHADQHGFQLLPVPIQTVHGAYHTACAGALWELTAWLPGAADNRPTRPPARLRAALVALAELHRAMASFPGPGIGRGPAPGIVMRQRQLGRLIDGGATRLAATIRPDVFPPMEHRARRLLAPFARLAPGVALQLQTAAMLNVPLQPCLRDIWSDHVLYIGLRVSGIVDFGAMRHDNVATDISRLLGSMAGSDRRAWDAGLAAYQSVRPLSAAERQLVVAFDRSSLLMAGLNWVEWIYGGQRRFENQQAILARVDRLLTRLERL